MREKVLKDMPKELNSEPISVFEAGQLTQAKFLNDYVKKNRPCLIKNAVKDWPAFHKWKDPNYLYDLCGDIELEVYAHRNYLNIKKMRRNVKKMNFSEALKLANENDDSVISMPANKIDNTGPFSELATDIGSFSFIENQSSPFLYHKNRFFAYKGAGTSWHQHPVDETLLCQIVGAKKVGLFCSSNPDYPQFEKAFRQDDHDQYQALLKKNARFLSVVTVEEGDSLYIPPYWFHGIDTVDNNFGISLAHCWSSSLDKFGETKYPTNRKYLFQLFKGLPSRNTIMMFTLCFGGLLLKGVKKMQRLFNLRSV